MNQASIFIIVLFSLVVVIPGIWITAMMIKRNGHNKLSPEDKEKIRVRDAANRLTPQQTIAQVQSGLKEYVSCLDGFEIGDSVTTDGGMGILAINSSATRIVFGFDSGERGRGHRMFNARDILSVELDTDIGSEPMAAGAFGDIAGLPFPGIRAFSWAQVKDVRLVVTVNDVKNPWAVASMPDLSSAEQWRGMISALTRKAAA